MDKKFYLKKGMIVKIIIVIDLNDVMVNIQGVYFYFLQVIIFKLFIKKN